MSTLSDLVDVHGRHSPADTEWLQLLVGDWQVISDLAFADLVLWLPTLDDDFIAVAQCRPSTGATVYHEDIVGRSAPAGLVPRLREAAGTQSVARGGETRWTGAYAIREEAIPVVRAGRTIAIIGRETHLGASRTPSRLEINYVESADELLGMITRGEFPSANAPTGSRRGAPRVGDGLVRLNSEGEVLYASPNALSAFHRLGISSIMVGQALAESITPMVESGSPVDESLPLVLMGRAAWRSEVEVRGVSLSVRALPVTEHGTRIGAVLLVRDVSELRRRERELMTKDATIREIHHRVKNNLQTVAALLRIQARRSSSQEVRAALDGAMRRVATIATVHEALSQTIEEVVDFDAVFGRALRLAADVASVDNAPVRFVREGTFGMVPAADATSLAVILTELVTNAVEHGLAATGGTVTVCSEREERTLRVAVIDDGIGIEPEAIDGLGTQIVSTLVDTVLDGSITWQARTGGGTQVILSARLADVAD
ncbi:MAG: sensor histidine kinase [Beutenbergiaceae bacterium]